MPIKQNIKMNRRARPPPPPLPSLPPAPPIPIGAVQYHEKSTINQCKDKLSNVSDRSDLSKSRIKAHVKGKRKAPPPPITVAAIQSNDKLTINHCENKLLYHFDRSDLILRNSLGKTPPPPLPPHPARLPVPPITVDAVQFNDIDQCKDKCPISDNAPKTMTNVPIQKRKKPAPLPPLATVICIKKDAQAMGDKMNNLSAVSKKVTDKFAVKANNLNIFEPNHISNDLPYLTKENNEVNVNLDGFLKCDIEKKDYNLPSIRRNSGESSTKEIDFKWNPNGIKPIRKIENADNVVKCNELSRDIRTHCDQMSLANMRKKFDCDANANGKREIPSTASNNSIKIDMENEISLNLYINFNHSVEVKANHEMSLDQFKMRIFEKMIPSRNPKIYFNGLLLRDDDQSLAKYGITNQSSLYINTENGAVEANAVNGKKSAIVHVGPFIKGERSNNEEAETIENNAEKALKAEKVENTEEVEAEKPSKSLFGDVIVKNDDGENLSFAHVQPNRYTIENVPTNANTSKVQYRSVYKNSGCYPEIMKILNNELTNLFSKSLNNATQTCVKNGPEKRNPVLEEDKSKPITQYIELLSLDDSMDLTKNTEILECTVCLVEYQPFEGVTLWNCSHTFCKDCVRNTIKYSDGAEVKCPYMDENYSCDCLLQDREIKAILSKTEYDDHLAKSLRIAENQIENSFHCKTPDCKGWCLHEDDVNTFKCPICLLENCLTCHVIHDGLDCKQYQNMTKNNSDKNPKNATTYAMLEEMIKNGNNRIDVMNNGTLSQKKHKKNIYLRFFTNVRNKMYLGKIKAVKKWNCRRDGLCRLQDCFDEEMFDSRNESWL